MIVACGTFVWDIATQLSVTSYEAEDPQTGEPSKFYEVHGVLFFGSTTHFLSLFDEKKDPDQVVLNFQAGYIVDYSAIQALNKLGERYGLVDKKVKLRQLKPSSERMVSNSTGLMVKEMSLQVDEEELLPAQREHMNVEHFDRHEEYVREMVRQDSEKTKVEGEESAEELDLE